MDRNYSKDIFKIITFSGVLIYSFYNLIKGPDISVETHPEFYKPMSDLEKHWQIKLLNGMRDGGYCLDRNLIAIDARTWED